jgi:hypothetical protein
MISLLWLKVGSNEDGTVQDDFEEGSVCDRVIRRFYR